MKTNKLIIAAIFIAVFEFAMLTIMFNSIQADNIIKAVEQSSSLKYVLLAAIISALSLWGMIDEIKAK